MSATRNLQLVTPYLVCSLEGVTHGFYMLWATAHQGIPTVAAAMAIAAGDVTLLALEVPTGMFADRLGARRSLILGSLAQAVGLVLFWRARSIPVLVAAVLAIALGDAFRHGADQALVYRSCAALGRAHDFGRVFARAEAWALAGIVTLTALGGWIAEHLGFDVAFAIDVLLALAGLAMACAMSDLPAAAGEPEDDEGSTSAGLVGLAGRLPWGILVPVSMVAMLGVAAEFFTQTTRREGFGAELVAFAIAGAMLLEAIGAWLVARGTVPIHRRTLDVIALASALALAMAAVAGPMLVPALVVIFVGTGIGPAVRAALVQQQARDGERATVASAASAVDMLGITVGVPLAAWLRERVGLAATAATLAGVVLVGWVLVASRGVKAETREGPRAFRS
jgi:predicted MFS family arabinose efflux permease